MDITCAPTTIDRAVGRVGAAVVLCPDCGAVVPVETLPGGATTVPAHTPRGE